MSADERVEGCAEKDPHTTPHISIMHTQWWKVIAWFLTIDPAHSLSELLLVWHYNVGLWLVAIEEIPDKSESEVGVVQGFR